jgi:hypothetical protein
MSQLLSRQIRKKKEKFKGKKEKYENKQIIIKEHEIEKQNENTEEGVVITDSNRGGIGRNIRGKRRVHHSKVGSLRNHRAHVNRNKYIINMKTNY